MNDLRIWKLVFEVRYPATALLFDKRGEIVNKWQWTNDLSEWRIANNQISIHNKSNSTFLNVSINRLVVSMELPINQDSFNKYSVEFSSWVLNKLEVKKIERVGLRAIQIAKRTHFKLLLNKMRQNLFKLNENDWKIFNGTIDDVAFPLVIGFGESKINFNSGPMQVEQLSNFFESQEVKSKLPNVSLFLDFDYFQSEPNILEDQFSIGFSLFLDKGIHQITEISERFMDKYGAFE